MKKKGILELLKRREVFIVTVDILLVIVMAIIKPIFVSPANLSALFLQIASTLLIAIGMTLMLVLGCIDLSVAANLCLAGTLSGMASLAGAPVWVCLLLALAVGAVGGTINGFLVSYFGLAPFVATLSSNYMLRGLVTGIRQGESIYGLSAAFQNLGQGRIAGVQYPIIISLVLFIVFVYLTSNMKFFRQAWYIGGNRKAALLSGIPVKRQMLLYYIISGTLCGLAGILTCSRFGAITAQTSKGLELTVITACVVGGVSMSGGSGTLFGALFGAFLMASINNIFNLFGLNNYWQDFITGVTLLTAVSIDQITIMNKRRQDTLHAEEMLRKMGETLNSSQTV